MNAKRTTSAALLTAALLLLLGAAAPRGEYDRTFSAAPGGRIELTMESGGSLEVQGWDRDQVRIVCSDRYNDLDEYDLEVRESRGGLDFTAELRDRSIQKTALRVLLTVPRRFDIAIESGGGGIHIEDVEGGFTGQTGGGQIELRRVKGEARLSSGGGGIEIVESDLDGRVSTGGGEVLVRDVVGNVKATSGGGNVSYENVRSRDGDRRGPNNLDIGVALEGTILRSTAGGSLNIREAPQGAILETGGGDIDVRGARKFVKATTGGGDIEIEVADGWVEASTGAGDIAIEVLGSLGDDGDHGVSVFTGYGNVTLTLPADISAELDVDLAYTRNSKRDYEIQSEFALEQEHTREWDSSQGTPRRHIYGTATLRGGKHLVKLNVVNGDVTIRKR